MGREGDGVGEMPEILYTKTVNCKFLIKDELDTIILTGKLYHGCSELFLPQSKGCLGQRISPIYLILITQFDICFNVL